MSLVTINLPSLQNGVSQQPPQVRGPDQCEVQENTWASLADGLLKRPPSEQVAKLDDAPLENAYVHPINRDTDERYTVIVANGIIRVFNEAGEEQVVTAPGGWGYLEGVEDYTADLSLTTIADYTFVVNRNKVCAMRTAPAPDPGTGEVIYPPLPGEDYFIPPRTPGSSPSDFLSNIPPDT